MKRLLLLSTALAFVAAPALSDEDVPTNIQRKYDRRLEEMKTLDKNKDGVLQVQELQGGVEKKFNAVDTNKDGVISSQEREAAIDSFKKNAQKTYGNMTDKRARKLENRYNSADKNEDGQISEQEYNAYFGGRYQNFDRNGDGVITEKEYRSDTEKVPRSYIKD